MKKNIKKNINEIVVCFFFTTLMVFVSFFTIDYFSLNSNESYANLEKAVKFSDFKSTRQPASGVRGFSVTIPAGEVVYLDESSNLDSLIINGELHCNEALAPNEIELKVKHIVVNGTFQCGTSTNPYKKKLIISLKHSNLDPKVDHKYRGIVVMNGGKLILNGNRKNAGWVKLSETANVGQNFIITNQIKVMEVERNFSSRKLSRTILPNYNKNPWKVGDEIVIGPTGYNYLEAERFKITGFDNSNPNKIFLDGTIQYKHWGSTQKFNSNSMGTITLDERAEVANLTRNIVIRADESGGLISEDDTAYAQRGGHIMVHHMGKAYIDSIELYKMGQAGVMARYPFHWHYVGNANGQYVKNSSIHHSFQRCITIHRTQNALLQNNVCYNFKGHGYFLEDGNETGNKIIRNLAIMARPPSASKVLLASDDISKSEGQGRFPAVSGFWISHPNNYIVNNVVSGSVGTGIWMSFEKEVKDGSGNVVATPLTSDTDVFNFNSAHACKVGITWDGAPGWQNANNPNNPNDKLLTSAHYKPVNIPTFRGLRAWKNYLSGIYFRGQTVVYKNMIVADNGWSNWFAYNQIVRDSVYIGKTNNDSPEMRSFYYSKVNRSRYRRTGMVLYDGPFEIHESDFINFSTQEESYQLPNNSIINSTVVPFTSTGGSNKFTNLVSGLTFSPEPIYKAHMESETVDISGRQMLANAVIRDSDGSLTGSGVESVVVAKRSMGILNNSGCEENVGQFFNFKICPANYTEGSLAFMRWGSNQASPWATPFIARRSDGALNYPKNEWNYVSAIPNNLIAVTNNSYISYEILPKYQYEKDRTIGATAAVDSNTESLNPIIPIVKILAYGNNCRLGLDAVETFSLTELKQQTTTAYYTSGQDFYVRVIPVERWKMIEDDPIVEATALATNQRYPITCDEGYLPKVVKGKITKVTRGSSTTTIEGYACNYTHNNSIQVKLYAYGQPIAVSENPTQGRGSVSWANVYTYLASSNSNLVSDEKVTFECGYLSASGRSFKFILNNSDLIPFENHKVAVKGISNTGGQDLYIQNSGSFYFKPRRVIATELPAELEVE